MLYNISLKWWRPNLNFFCILIVHKIHPIQDTVCSILLTYILRFLQFEDCTFEWLYWPQARQPYSTETIDYIKSLDAEEDIALLKFHGWDLPLECARTLRVSTMLLKKAVDRGLTPYDIGNIMCRKTLKKESIIEEIVQEARDSVLPGTSEAAFLDTVSQIMDCHLDKIAGWLPLSWGCLFFLLFYLGNIGIYKYHKVHRMFFCPYTMRRNYSFFVIFPFFHISHFLLIELKVGLLTHLFIWLLNSVQWHLQVLMYYCYLCYL